jgi:hypothetical protein
MSDELLADFTDWLDESDEPDVLALVDHAETFLRWRADAPLASLTEDDVLTFMLDHCPRQLALPAESAGDVCDAMAEFCMFLGQTRRLRGGPDQGRLLARRANTLERAMRAAIADQTDNATAKSRGATPDLTEVALDTLIAVINSAPREQHSALLAEWKPMLSAPERAGIVAASITDSTDAGSRLAGLNLLGMFHTDVAEPYMRQLLDTAAAGHAAIWLLDHGLADGDAVGGFITPAIMVDILSQLVDHPEVLCEQFVGGHDPHRMLEFFWRHPAPETAAVLDVLGRYLPDRVLAKEARRAGVKHRSWLANRDCA